MDTVIVIIVVVDIHTSPRFSSTFLPKKEKCRLMRSLRCVCVCVCVFLLQLLYQFTDFHEIGHYFFVRGCPKTTHFNSLISAIYNMVDV
jgi:hypothetical protein